MSFFCKLYCKTPATTPMCIRKAPNRDEWRIYSVAFRRSFMGMRHIEGHILQMSCCIAHYWSIGMLIRNWTWGENVCTKLNNSNHGCIVELHLACWGGNINWYCITENTFSVNTHYTHHFNMLVASCLNLYSLHPFLTLWQKGNVKGHQVLMPANMICMKYIYRMVIIHMSLNIFSSLQYIVLCMVI